MSLLPIAGGAEDRMKDKIGIREEMRNKGITPKNYFKQYKKDIMLTSAVNHQRRKLEKQQQLQQSQKPRGTLKRSTQKHTELNEKKLHEHNKKQEEKEKHEDKPDHLYHDESKCLEPNYETNPHLHSDYGKLPRYLVDRKKQWEDERKVEYDRKYGPPPGVRVISESERLRALDTLRHNKQAVEVFLATQLPLYLDSVRLIKKKEFYEEKLKEIERDIILYSRVPVYVRDDDLAD
eukprot:TRINITY_DN5023_c0_g1_i1.p1 TRINITY_DN5023_c0_g1~~TRINITY_DN5023_c0_g1_i1.p1  ORF type:complete len:262 (-),score=78.56 TRINITY_DN5023_c0_g1_i1:188-892(-)